MKPRYLLDCKKLPESMLFSTPIYFHSATFACIKYPYGTVCF